MGMVLETQRDSLLAYGDSIDIQWNRVPVVSTIGPVTGINVRYGHNIIAEDGYLNYQWNDIPIDCYRRILPPPR